MKLRFSDEFYLVIFIGIIILVFIGIVATSDSSKYNSNDNKTQTSLYINPSSGALEVVPNGLNIPIN